MRTIFAEYNPHRNSIDIRTGLTVLYAYLCLYCNYFIFIFQIMPFVFLQKLV